MPADRWHTAEPDAEEGGFGRPDAAREISGRDVRRSLLLSMFLASRYCSGFMPVPCLSAPHLHSYFLPLLVFAVYFFLSLLHSSSQVPCSSSEALAFSCPFPYFSLFSSFQGLSLANMGNAPPGVRLRYERVPAKRLLCELCVSVCMRIVERDIRHRELGRAGQRGGRSAGPILLVVVFILCLIWVVR